MRKRYKLSSGGLLGGLGFVAIAACGGGPRQPTFNAHPQNVCQHGNITVDWKNAPVGWTVSASPEVFASWTITESNGSKTIPVDATILGDQRKIVLTASSGTDTQNLTIDVIPPGGDVYNVTLSADCGSGDGVWKVAEISPDDFDEGALVKGVENRIDRDIMVSHAGIQEKIGPLGGFAHSIYTYWNDTPLTGSWGGSCQLRSDPVARVYESCKDVEKDTTHFTAEHWTHLEPPTIMFAVTYKCR